MADVHTSTAILAGKLNTEQLRLKAAVRDQLLATSPEVATRVAAEMDAARAGQKQAYETLNAMVSEPREREILEHIAQGRSNKEIARGLGIAETTVKIHVQHVLRKLGVDSRVQAAVMATEQRKG